MGLDATVVTVRVQKTPPTLGRTYRHERVLVLDVQQNTAAGVRQRAAAPAPEVKDVMCDEGGVDQLPACKINSIDGLRHTVEYAATKRLRAL
jgi:hypothetical protein